MVDIYEELGKKTPRYSMKYRQLIEGFAKKGDINYYEKRDDSYDLGKFFDNFYEFYIYACFMGIYTKNPVPLARKEDAKNFSVQMRNWSSNNSAPIVKYLWMIIFNSSEIDFNALEEMEDKEVESAIKKVSRQIEAYANGGFAFIQSKIDENKAFFDDDQCFVKLLNKVEGNN